MFLSPALMREGGAITVKPQQNEFIEPSCSNPALASWSPEPHPKGPYKDYLYGDACACLDAGIYNDIAVASTALTEIP